MCAMANSYRLFKLESKIEAGNFCNRYFDPKDVMGKIIDDSINQGHWGDGIVVIDTRKFGAKIALLEKDPALIKESKSDPPAEALVHPTPLESILEDDFQLQLNEALKLSLEFVKPEKIDVLDLDKLPPRADKKDPVKAKVEEMREASKRRSIRTIQNERNSLIAICAEYDNPSSKHVERSTAFVHMLTVMRSTFPALQKWQETSKKDISFDIFPTKDTALYMQMIQADMRTGIMTETRREKILKILGKDFKIGEKYLTIPYGHPVKNTALIGDAFIRMELAIKTYRFCNERKISQTLVIDRYLQNRTMSSIVQHLDLECINPSTMMALPMSDVIEFIAGYLVINDEIGKAKDFISYIYPAIVWKAKDEYPLIELNSWMFPDEVVDGTKHFIDFEAVYLTPILS